MSRPLDPIPMPYVDPKKKEEAEDTVIPYDYRSCNEDMQGTLIFLRHKLVSNNQIDMATLKATRRGTTPRR